MKESLIKLIELLPDDIDGVIITSDINRRYLTDLKSSAGTLLVTKKTAALIIDFRYIEIAKKTITDFDVILQTNKLYEQIKDFFDANNVKTVALEADHVTMEEYNRFLKNLDSFNILSDSRLSNIILDLRSVKSKQELEFIKTAQQITDKAFLEICNFIKEGKTELEVAAELEYLMKRNGATGIAFETIAVSGINSSMPHGVPTSKRLQKGDFLTMDFGASYNGYCSDMTRTVAIGEISEKQKRVYDTVLKAQLNALDAIAVGKKYSDIDKTARDLINKSGYEGCFGHALGHSLGLYIHENPRFAPNYDYIIKPGGVLSVEPGIYIENEFGVRIEDIVYIEENKVINLTKSEKNLITL